MLSFLFWNLARKPLAATLERLIERERVDIVILAESALEPGDLSVHHAPSRVASKIQIWTRFPTEWVTPFFDVDSARFTVRLVSVPGWEEIILVAVHLPDKRSVSESSQHSVATDLGRQIRWIESERGHRRTLAIGDFNMNPFEAGMVDAAGLHAVMSQEIARNQGGVRTVQGNAYPFFYNPMWSLLGDMSVGPPGTYFYRRAEPVCYFWNTFDQALLRPDLIPFWKPFGIRVITGDGERSFLTNRRVPDQGTFSDHLPLLVRLEKE